MKKYQKPIIIPREIEVNTQQLINVITENEKIISILKYDLAIYSTIISEILNLNIKTYDGKYYIDLSKITEICEEYFKKLSTNKGK